MININDIIEYYKFPSELDFDKNKLKDVEKELNKILPIAYIDKPHCNCNDVNCPHKQIISPMFLLLIETKISECINFENNFNPLKYDILDLPDMNPINIFIDKRKKSFYSRYSIPIIINDIFEPSRCFDLFEGFIFEEDMNGEIVIIEMNGNETSFEIKNNKLFTNGQYFPLVASCYTKIKFNFNKQKQIKAKIITGNINFIARTELISRKYFVRLTSDYVLRCFQSCSTIYKQINTIYSF